MFLLDLTGTDSTPELTVGFQMDWASFTIGVLAAFGVVLLVKMIKYFIKAMKEDKKWLEDKMNSQKSDE